MDGDKLLRNDCPLTVPFACEADLVAAAVAVMSQGFGTWGIAYFALEFDYRRGRTDIVALSREGEVIAIEAKLSDWREALQQAYRNTSFACESYILMPSAPAQRAAEHALEFDRHGVGICTLISGHLAVLHPARRHDDPLEPWLAKRAAIFAHSAAE